MKKVTNFYPDRRTVIRFGRNQILLAIIGSALFAQLETAVAVEPIEIAKLVATDGARGDLLGRDVAISGDTAVVASDSGIVSPDAAYVFRKDSLGHWIEQAKLVPSDATTADGITDVAIDGNTIVIGASGDDDNGENAGAAYVFVLDTTSGSWIEQAKLLAPDGQAFDQFGKSVSIAGGLIFVGAPFGDGDTRYTNTGAAYVFHTTIEGQWFAKYILQSIVRAANDVAQIGYSIAAAAGTDDVYAVVGAPKYDVLGPDGFYVNAGAAFIFKLPKPTAPDTTPSPPIRIGNPSPSGFIGAYAMIASEPNGVANVAYLLENANLGWSVDIWAGPGLSGDLVVDYVATLVGAPHADTFVSDGGVGIRYDDSGMALMRVECLHVSVCEIAGRSFVVGDVFLEQTDRRPGDQLGWSVALDYGTDGLALVGASKHDHDGFGAIGSVYGFDFFVDDRLFDLIQFGTTVSSRYELTPNDLLARNFGTEMDVSGKTAVIGEPSADSLKGAVYVYGPDAIHATKLLIATVQTMNLQQGIDSSLDAKLEAVTAALTDINQNNNVAGINLLNAFIESVEAQKGHKLTFVQAEKLISLALDIIRLLSE